MTATKETTLATSFIVILIVITTMTMNDDVFQVRSIITESFLNHSILSRTSHGLLHVHTWRVCWSRQMVLGLARWCFGEFPLPERFVDVIICEEWSFVSCPIGSSLRDLRRVSEYSVL